MSKRGRKPVVDKEAIIEYAKANPGAYQKDIAERFDTTRWYVGFILREANVQGTYRGRSLDLKRRPQWSDEQYEWEKRLCALGLGMQRGRRSHVLYGWEPLLQRHADSKEE